MCFCDNSTYINKYSAYNAPASETKCALIVKHLFYCIKNHRKLFCGQNFVQVLIDPAIFSGDVA